jgi:hypothetical protein
LGLGTVYLTVHFPKVGNDDFLMKLLSLVSVTPLFFATVGGIPVSVSIKIEINKLSFIIPIIVFALITSVFAIYFGRYKPVLFDLIEHRFTNSFVLVFPFLCFSFVFLVLSNSLLLGIEYFFINQICSPKAVGRIYMCFMLVFAYSRLMFALVVCGYLYSPLLAAFRSFLLNK